MYKIINNDNDIFKSKEYMDDKYLFVVFDKKINNENTKIMSDEKTKKELSNENFYILRNKDNKIVCMARYTIDDNKTAKIGLVYTPDEERCKGYAGKIVYELTKKIFEIEHIPVLYTDQSNLNSNKAYANVGYVNRGTLINFICSKN